MKTKKNPKTKTTTLTRGSYQTDTPHVTFNKPKDWANKARSEGRGGERKKPARPIKLKDCMMRHDGVLDFLVPAKVGRPDSSWLVTCNNPPRKLTSEDAVDLFAYLSANRFEFISMKQNSDKRVVQFDDLTGIIDTDKHTYTVATVAKHLRNKRGDDDNE